MSQKCPAIDATLTYSTFSNEQSQSQSPLFQLPREVRQQIYSYTFHNHESVGRSYLPDTYWYRPGCTAPLVIDTDLIQTCKRIYQEACHIPWSSRLITIWLADSDRSPEKIYKDNAFDVPLENITRALEEPDSSENPFAPSAARSGDVDVDHIRIFAQIHLLQSTGYLNFINNNLLLRPRHITITIRHTDWSLWEDDDPLELPGDWVEECRFASSVEMITLELESLERKKEQVQSIAEQIQQNWYFTRDDDVVLTARSTPIVVDRWKGSSIFYPDRWIRDEVEPEVLAYYVASVTWRDEPEVDKDDLQPPETTESLVEQEQLDVETPMLSVTDLEDAEVPPKTPGEQAAAMVEEWQSMQ